MTRKYTQLKIPFPEYPIEKIPVTLLSEPYLIPEPSYRISEVELIYKSKTRPDEWPSINTSKDTYKLLMSIWDDNKIDMQEEFKVLYLNAANKVIAAYHMSTGGISGTVADTRLVLVGALKTNAVGIILSHNHPSCRLTPSRQDENLTEKIQGAAKLMDIRVLDHVIVARNGYLSFADSGLL